MRLLVMICALLPAALPAAAQPRTLSGYVQDASSGERLIGASLWEGRTGAGAVTNAYGFFSLRLPPGEALVAVSYIGYRTDTLRVGASEGSVQRVVELAPTAGVLGEVEVTAERHTLGEPTLTTRVSIQEVEQIPALLGETDLLKAMQLLPGVKSGAEGSGGLYVRGGAPDQNLILLDGTPVFNAFHLFGFVSVFNTDALRSVDLLKGGFPARYGGRLSSVIEVAMKEGNMRRRAVRGSIGIVSSRLTLEAPIRRDRTSFILSGRRTYIDALTRPFLSYEQGKPTAYFYDASAKVNHILSPRDRLYLSVYAGSDRFGSETRGDWRSTGSLGWGNTTAAFRWNRLWSPRLFANTTLTHSRFGLGVKIEERGAERDADGFERIIASGARYDSGIHSEGAKTDVDWIPSGRHYVRIGGALTRYRFNPGALNYRSETGVVRFDTTLATSSTRAVEGAAYAEDDVRLGRSVRLNAGLHAALFAVQGKPYLSAQPRAALFVAPASGWTLHASYADMRQHIHLLSHASGLGLPTDLWVPSTRTAPPERSWQAGVGVEYAFGRYAVSAEKYYKEMHGLLAYREGASYLTPGADWEDMVTRGRGWAGGLELLLRRRTGRTTGWASYTYARSMRRFPEISRGLAFPDRYDRRHDVSLVVLTRLGRRLDASLTWVYLTGNAVTLPVALYETYRKGVLGYFQTIQYFGERRNGYRMPSYHRLDLGLTYYFARRPGREHALALGAYNAYNRLNPFYLDLERTPRDDGSMDARLKGYAIFPIVPSLSYSFEF